MYKTYFTKENTRCTITSLKYVSSNNSSGILNYSLHMAWKHAATRKNRSCNTVTTASSSLGSRCVPWLGEGLIMSSPNYPVLCCPLPYRVAPVFVQVVSPPLGWSPLPSFLVIWSPSGEARGPSVVFEADDIPYPGPFHFYHSVDYIYEFCPLPDPDVGPSIFVCDVEHTSFILVCAAASLFCACLVSVQVSAPYVIAGSTQELYTCLFRPMARLRLKISRCLAYAAQPAMILRCISLSWFFSLRLQCCPKYT